jgi:hypothetical protein
VSVRVVIHAIAVEGSYREQAENMYSPIVLPVVSFLVALAVTPALRKLFKRWGILDVPDGKLKTHLKPVATLGGVPILLSFLAAYAMLLLTPPGGGGGFLMLLTRDAEAADALRTELAQGAAAGAPWSTSGSPRTACGSRARAALPQVQDNLIQPGSRRSAGPTHP